MEAYSIKLIEKKEKLRRIHLGRKKNLESKVRSRNFVKKNHQGRHPGKIFWTIRKMDKGELRLNRPNDKKIDNDAQDITPERQHMIQENQVEEEANSPVLRIAWLYQ